MSQTKIDNQLRSWRYRALEEPPTRKVERKGMGWQKLHYRGIARSPAMSLVGHGITNKRCRRILTTAIVKYIDKNMGYNCQGG